jgi:S1-C subfamily serine protease
VKRRRLVLIGFLVSGCAGFGQQIRITDLKPEDIAAYRKIVIYTDELPTDSYETIGRIKGISCKGEYYSNVSEREAFEQLKAKAAARGSNGLTHLACEHHAGGDWGNKCFQTYICTGLAIRVGNPKAVQSFALARQTETSHSSQPSGPPPQKMGPKGADAAVPPAPPPDNRTPPSPSLSPKRQPHVARSGSGFFVTGVGHVLTNHHVIDGCRAGLVWPAGQGWQPARVLGIDAKNDLAILKVDARVDALAAFRATAIRQGEPIMTYGFPLAGALASAGSATTGNISALAGMADDSRFLQFSAPVQPGNSGGPLLDETGSVVGVVVSKLNAIAVAKVIGDVPQNVNFALKGAVVKAFLESQGVVYEVGVPVGAAKRPPELADMARSFTVRIGCAQD